MDVLLRLLLGSHRRDVAQRKCRRLIEPPNGPESQSRQEQWRRGKWCFISFGLHTFGALDRTGANDRLHTFTQGGLRNALRRDRERCEASAVPPGVAGEVRKREPSREIKFGRGGIVSIIERDRPDGRRIGRQEGP